MLINPSIKKVLFAGYRSCYPFYIGGDGLVIHFLLQGLGRFYQVDCLHLGGLAALELSPSHDHIDATLRSLNVTFETSGGSELSSYSRIDYVTHGYQATMVEANRFLNDLEKIISTWQPDIVLTAEENSELILDVAFRHKKATALFITHAEMEENEIFALSRKASLIVYPSLFLLNKYGDKYHCRSVVIPPIYNWHLWMTSSNTRRYISMLNPVPEKGLDIFLRIVERLPGLEFMTQDVWYPARMNQTGYSNLFWRPREYADSNNNIGLSYFLGNTKLLLVPSLWEDASPAIVIQAMKNGIPVIGSCRGGIPEIIGDAGVIIENYLDVDTWIEKIQLLTTDEKLYCILAARSRKRAEKYSYQRQLKSVYKQLQSLLA